MVLLGGLCLGYLVTGRRHNEAGTMKTVAMRDRPPPKRGSR